MIIHIIKISWRTFKETIKKQWKQITDKDMPPTDGIF